MRTLLVAMNLSDGRKQRILDAAGGFNIIFDASPTEEQIASAEIVIGNAPVGMLMESETLRLVQLHSAGVGEYRRLCAPGRNVRLCNASGAYGLAISEHMFAMLTALQKRLVFYRDIQPAGAWKDLGTVKSVYGSKVLVIGLGNIGGEFARRCKAFGAHVTGVRRTGGERPDCCDEVIPTDRLDEVLPEADIVFMAVPETAGTVGMMNRARIDSMKRGAILLNAGRGSAVDTDALVDALNEGRLFGAGLDVTAPEPLPEDHPLWRCSNALITPHVSGGEHLESTFDRVVDIACDNIRAYLSGGALRSQVDYERGY